MKSPRRVDYPVSSPPDEGVSGDRKVEGQSSAGSLRREIDWY